MSRKRKIKPILKSEQALRYVNAHYFAHHGYDAQALSNLLQENDIVTFFGREQHYENATHVRTKSLNYYVFGSRDWSKINGLLNDIYVKETALRNEVVEEKYKLALEGIKSFHQRIWFDLSKQSNAIEGVFADYEMTPIEFEQKLGEIFHIPSPKTRVFDSHKYCSALREAEEKIESDETKKVIKGRNKEHTISNELLRHYIAFKYAYKCAKMFAQTRGVTNKQNIEKELCNNADFQQEFEGLSVQHIQEKIVLTPEKMLELTNDFISLLTGRDYVGYRQDQAYVTLYGDRDFAGWTPVSEMRVESQLQSWAEWVVNENSLHPIEKAAIAQAEFVRIHPFADGNGRTSRIIANFILMVNDLPTIQVRGYDNFDKIPDDLAKSDSQPITYFNALNKAIREHDANDLVAIFEQGMIESSKCVQQSLDDIEKNKDGLFYTETAHVDVEKQK